MPASPIWLMSSEPYIPMSSRRPTKGETNAAPALAARSAWWGEKISVTLTLIPSDDSCFVVLRVSMHMGSLMLMLGWIFASSRRTESHSSFEKSFGETFMRESIVTCAAVP